MQCNPKVHLMQLFLMFKMTKPVPFSPHFKHSLGVLPFSCLRVCAQMYHWLCECCVCLCVHACVHVCVCLSRLKDHTHTVVQHEYSPLRLAAVVSLGMGSRVAGGGGGGREGVHSLMGYPGT